MFRVEQPVCTSMNPDQGYCALHVTDDGLDSTHKHTVYFFGLTYVHVKMVFKFSFRIHGSIYRTIGRSQVNVERTIDMYGGH
jgi:hypothetical protein